MKLVDRINDSGNQRFTLSTIDEGRTIQCELRYTPTQRQWVIDIIYQDYTLRGIALVLSPNLLRNYKNILPFGFAVTSKDGFDPYYLQDFISERCSLYLLSREEVAGIEQSLENEAQNTVTQLIKEKQFIVTEADSLYIVTEDNKKILAEQEAYV